MKKNIFKILVGDRMWIKNYIFDLLGLKDKLYIFILKIIFFYFIFKIIFDFCIFLIKKLNIYYNFLITRWFEISYRFLRKNESYFRKNKIMSIFLSFFIRLLKAFYKIIKFKNFINWLNNFSFQKTFYILSDKFILFIVKVLDIIFFKIDIIDLGFFIFYKIKFFILDSFIIAFKFIWTITIPLWHFLLKIFTFYTKFIYIRKRLKIYYFYVINFRNVKKINLKRIKGQFKLNMFFKRWFLFFKDKKKIIIYIFLKLPFFFLKLNFYFFYFIIKILISLFFLFMFIFDAIYLSMHYKNNY